MSNKDVNMEQTGEAMVAQSEADCQPTQVLPVSTAQRLVSMDVLRGVALLGILLMNIQAFSMTFSAYSNPLAYGDFTGANYWARYLSSIFADQKFMTIFSMLFGAGIVLMAQKSEAKGVKATGIHYRRMGWLMLFGLIHGFGVWAGDILLTYSICGMFAYLFRNLKPKKLMIVGMSGIVFCSLIFMLIGLSFEHWEAKDIAMMQDLWSPSAEQIQQDLLDNTGSWVDQGPARAKLFQMMLESMPMYAFRIVGLMLIGMALYKSNILDASRENSYYLRHGLISLVIGLALVIIGLDKIEASGWDMAYTPFIGSQYNYWSSIIMAWAYVCIVQLLCRLPSREFMTRTFAPVGQMALSNYLFHSIVCGFIFYGWGLGFYGSVERIGQVGIVVAVWIVQIALSKWWLNKYRFGPFEWAWRSLTYWQRQPMAK